MILEWITIGAYFIFLLVLGIFFSRLNRNLSDYIRDGAQATGWLAGTSALMGGISAFSFTGNAARSVFGRAWYAHHLPRELHRAVAVLALCRCTPASNQGLHDG